MWLATLQNDIRDLLVAGTRSLLRKLKQLVMYPHGVGGGRQGIKGTRTCPHPRCMRTAYSMTGFGRDPAVYLHFEPRTR